MFSIEKTSKLWFHLLHTKITLEKRSSPISGSIGREYTIRIYLGKSQPSRLYGCMLYDSTLHKYSIRYVACNIFYQMLRCPSHSSSVRFDSFGWFAPFVSSRLSAAVSPRNAPDNDQEGDFIDLKATIPMEKKFLYLDSAHIP